MLGDMKAHGRRTQYIIGVSALLVVYFCAYFALVQREEFLFNGQFKGFIPQGSLHRVPHYRYLDDDYFITEIVFAPTHAVDVILRPGYWSEPDNQ